MQTKGYTDTQLLDWLQSRTKRYSDGWVCRSSATGRGMRLHETSKKAVATLPLEHQGTVHGDVRQAIIAAIEKDDF